MTIAFVALGANIDDPRSQVLKALQELDRIPESRVVSRSSLYRTAPVGFSDQPDFINAVARLDTALEAKPLLAALHELENRHGRRRSLPNAPRTLDLDLLMYADHIVDEEGLHLPHPRLHQRAFVLAPLAEIAPDAIVPGKGRVGDLLNNVDRSGVELMDGG